MHIPSCSVYTQCVQYTRSYTADTAALHFSSYSVAIHKLHTLLRTGYCFILARTNVAVMCNVLLHCSFKTNINLSAALRQQSMQQCMLQYVYSAARMQQCMLQYIYFAAEHSIVYVAVCILCSSVCYSMYTLQQSMQQCMFQHVYSAAEYPAAYVT